MSPQGRLFLLGIGLFGMVLGACLGLVAGALKRDCAEAERAAAAEGAARASAVLDGLCGRVARLHLSAFGLVAMSAAAALVPLVQERAEARTGR